MIKEYFKKVKLTSVLFSLIYFFFGLSLIIWPDATKITIISLFGGILVLYGIVGIVNYFIYGYEPFGFLNGFIQTTFGILTLCFAKTLADASILSFIFGVMFVFNSLIKMQTSFDYRRQGQKNWWLNSIFALIMFVLGLVILISPFKSEKILLIFLGSAIIIDSILQLVSTFTLALKARKIKHTLKDIWASGKEEIDITEYNNEMNNKDNK